MGRGAAGCAGRPPGWLRSFFATLKKELVRNQAFSSRDAARSDVFEYIEVFYNRQRAHSWLNYKTPTAFEACDPKSESA